MMVKGKGTLKNYRLAKKMQITYKITLKLCIKLSTRLHTNYVKFELTKNHEHGPDCYRDDAWWGIFDFFLVSTRLYDDKRK